MIKTYLINQFIYNLDTLMSYFSSLATSSATDPVSCQDVKELSLLQINRSNRNTERELLSFFLAPTVIVCFEFAVAE